MINLWLILLSVTTIESRARWGYIRSEHKCECCDRERGHELHKGTSPFIAVFGCFVLKGAVHRLHIVLASMRIRKLSKSASSSIISTSSLLSQVLVLKELIENSIDAICSYDNHKNVSVLGQISIEIDKNTAGLDYISIKDDGSGIDRSDRGLLCLNCTTSKLKSLHDLETSVVTCGFRGEALHFIAGLASNLQICTKTNTDKAADTWTVNRSGISNGDNHSSPGVTGTTIKIKGLFQNTTVRHKFLKQKKTKLLKEIEDLIFEYAIIYRNIRFQLRYVSISKSGQIINGVNKVYPNKTSRTELLYNTLQLHKKDWFFEKKFDVEVKDFKINVDVILPKMRAQDVPSIKKSIRILVVNGRPLNLALNFGKSLLHKINESYKENMLILPIIWYVSLSIPLADVDINIEPSKSDIIVKNEKMFFEKFKEELIGIVNAEHENLKSAKTIDMSNPMISDFEKNGERESLSTENDFCDIMSNFNEADESLIQELDLSIKKLKNDYTGSTIVNTVKDIEKTDVLFSAETLSPKQTNEIDIQEDIEEISKLTMLLENEVEEDEDNDWSRTLYDSTEVTSDTEAAGNHKIGDSNINKERGLEIYERNEKEENKTTNHNQEQSKLDFTIHTSGKGVFNSEIPRDQVTSLKSSNHKQITASPYVTIQITDQVKKIPTKKFSDLPKIVNCSQNTFASNHKTDFKLSTTLKQRSLMLSNDEKWYNRDGVPSNILLDGLHELYERISYTASTNMPIIDDKGVFQFK